MRPILEIYRTVHEQGFLPIFTEDGRDAKPLVESCVLAGCKAIEYTLRRRDAPEMIPWIRQRYPDLLLLVGSILDGEALVERARRHHPQLRTLDEPAACDVDGFISMVGFRNETIERRAATHLIAAPVSTIFEAHSAVLAGAHFCKIVGPELGVVRHCAANPTFGVVPIMVTGGMDLERIPKTIESGAILVASGFDLMLKGKPLDLPVEHVADILRRFLDTTREARDQKYPELAAARSGDDATWLGAIPHHHPF